MDILQKFRESVEKYPDHNAFYIGKEFYNYRTFAGIISGIRKHLRKEIKGEKNIPVAVMAWDNIHTYASVYAIWLEGRAFLPLSPRNPASRNNEIIHQTGAKLLLTSETVPLEMLSTRHIKRLPTTGLFSEKIDLDSEGNAAGDLLYILFTSGSTGKPKGVTITHANFNAFAGAFLELGYHFTAEDKFLQIYDLTFDASLHCYAIPLCFGACVYTVPWNEVKYMYALRLLQNHDLTFAKMPPSTIAFLRPYFPSIQLEKLRYCLFGGEALDAALVNAWKNCVPNAVIQNVYGPTEVTINCLAYTIPGNEDFVRQYNGIVPLGKPFGTTKAVIAGPDHIPLPSGTKGELCLSGDQVSPGYWNDEEKNQEAFFSLKTGRKEIRYYATGDRAFVDKDGYFMFCGRIDSQVQIQGFRVELGEIEYHARAFLQTRAVALARENYLGTQQIHLFVEKCEDPQALKEHLAGKLPDYMLPAEIISLESFPQSVSGKIDRKKLLEMI